MAAADPAADPARTSPLGERVARARARAFVGREPELRLVDAALRGDDGAPSVLLVHGPGGIGKSTLLHRAADRAAERGRPVVRVDGSFALGSTSAFEAAAGEARTSEGAVLLVDTFEQCQWLERWLRERFLPTLPADVVVVVAGRETPELEWTLDPGWSSLTVVVPLGPLARGEAEVLLADGGMAPRRRDRVLRFAGGNPLVLSLALAVPEPAGGGMGTDEEPGADGAAARWAPPPTIVRTLVARLVGEVPSTAHGRALHAAAQARITDEALLAAVLPDEDVDALFSWLAGLPFVEVAGRGVHPHDAAREALVADLRWRAGTGDGEVRRLLTAHLVQRVRDVGASQADAAMAELAFAHRDAPRYRRVYAWDRRGQVESEPLAPAALPVATAMARAAEGERSAELVAYWFARAPEAFRLYRSIDTGEPVAVAARLVLDEERPEDTAADPVVAAAWRYCARTGLPTPGEHIAIRRFTLQSGPPVPSPAVDLASWQSLAAICRSPRLAQAFVVYPDVEPWRAALGATAERVPIDGVPGSVLFANDWRQLTFEQWFDRATADPSAEVAPASPGPGLPHDEFEVAVREALALWRRRGGLRDSRLADAGLVGSTGDDVDAALRDAVRDALAGMRADPRALRGHDAVEATYLGAATTQQAAARRLGVPFSSYRRHLGQGLTELTERLWRAAGGR